MKIVIATGIYPPDIGGPATYVPEVAKALVEKEHTVTVVTYKKRGITAKKEPWRVIRVARWRPKIIKVPLYTLRLFFATLNADVIFSQSPVSVGLSAYIVTKILKKPLIVKVVGDVAWERGQLKGLVRTSIDNFNRSEWKRSPYSVRFLAKWERRVTQAATRIIVPSRYLRNVVLSWKVHADAIIVILNGINTWSIRNTVAPTKSDKRLALLSIGRLVPWKHMDDIVKTVVSLMREPSFRHIQLLILGDGPERTNLENLIEKEAAQKHVMLTGSMDRDTVIQALKWADMFILNSSYEGLSHQLLEACAAGIPIISTKAGGNPEVIEDNESGILIPTGDRSALRDAIIRLAKNRNLRKQLSEKCQKRAKQFSHKIMLEKTIAVITTTIKPTS